MPVIPTAKLPRQARRLHTFAEFEGYLRDFAEGGYSFLWGVGRPGLGKTESLMKAILGREVYYRKGGQLTPVQLYLDCYKHRGKPILLDDAEHLLDNPVGAKLISSLTDTTPSRQISWSSTTKVLGDVPQSYETTSHLCILSNRLTTHRDIHSRAVILDFNPTNAEIHRGVARWFWDQEIHDWVGQHLSRLGPMDIRWYIQADQDKRRHRDWKQIILSAYARTRVYCLIQDLEADPAYPTREEKARRLEEIIGTGKGASRANYFRMRRRLKNQSQLIVETIPPIPLQHSKRPDTPSLLELEAAAESSLDENDASPARDQFAAPINGSTAPGTRPALPPADDRTAWEKSKDADNDDESEP